MSEGPIPPERLARALTLLSYLLAEDREEVVSLVTLCHDLGITKKEANDDLQLLNLVNHGGGTYVITGEIVGDEVHVTREPTGEAMARPARLSPLMARALLLTVDLIGEQLPVDSRRSLASAGEKIRKLIDGTDLPGVVNVGERREGESEVVHVLNQALQGNLLVEIEYYTPSRDRLSTRAVEPYLLFQSKDAWYLEAFCLSAQAQRTFRLDLVRSASLEGRSFVPRDDVDLVYRKAEPLSVPPRQAKWATVRFPASRGRALEEQGLEVTLMQDGDIRARIPYLDERWLIREMLKYAGDASIESPEALRARMAEETRAIAATYEKARPVRRTE